MRWTRQRCQVAFSTRAAAAFRPSWGVGDHQLGRAGEPPQELRPEVSASEGTRPAPRTSRGPSVLTATATVAATETIRATVR
jgi:hypothetical protein